MLVTAPPVLLLNTS